jgi:hypothetical protein
MHGAGIGVPRSTTLGDVTLGPGSSSAMGPRVSRLLLLGSHGSPSLPINS